MSPTPKTGNGGDRPCRFPCRLHDPVRVRTGRHRSRQPRGLDRGTRVPQFSCATNRWLAPWLTMLTDTALARAAVIVVGSVVLVAGAFPAVSFAVDEISSRRSGDPAT